MLYRFKSQDTAELVMLGADAQAALRLMGKALTPQGVISPDQLDHAIAALQQAWHDDRALRRQEAAVAPDPHTDDMDDEPDVRLSQRLVPLVKTLELAKAAGVAVVWSDA